MSKWNIDNFPKDYLERYCPTFEDDEVIVKFLNTKCNCTKTMKLKKVLSKLEKKLLCDKLYREYLGEEFSD